MLETKKKQKKKKQKKKKQKKETKKRETKCKWEKNEMLYTDVQMHWKLIGKRKEKI